mmetsp:Transcript_54462/g.127174  ORF Transcript_54462/g.127174 Transcript_54462/m.127174 type:complete len:321 (+) Transcript_54462:81-1043(+)
MLWGAYAYGVVPSGALLVSLLLSGSELCQGIAKAVLQLRIKMGKFEVPLVGFASVFCIMLVLVCFANVQHEKDYGRKQKDMFTRGIMSYDQHQRNLFLKERNLWLSVLGLAIWVCAWRLMVMKRNGMLLNSKEAKNKTGPPSIVKRIMWILIAVICVAMADVPLCRLNYNYQLHANVTPEKETLLQQAAGCERAKLEDATGQCKDLCQATERLSQARLDTIMWARDWHVLGRYAAQVFDNVRGMKQGQDRISKLFSDRSCVEVLKAVDKSNPSVNGICMIAACVSLLGALMAASRAFDCGAGELVKSLIDKTKQQGKKKQ